MIDGEGQFVSQMSVEILHINLDGLSILSLLSFLNSGRIGIIAGVPFFMWWGIELVLKTYICLACRSCYQLSRSVQMMPKILCSTCWALYRYDSRYPAHVDYIVIPVLVCTLNAVVGRLCESMSGYSPRLAFCTNAWKIHRAQLQLIAIDFNSYCICFCTHVMANIFCWTFITALN